MKYLIGLCLPMFFLLLGCSGELGAKNSIEQTISLMNEKKYAEFWQHLAPESKAKVKEQLAQVAADEKLSRTVSSFFNISLAQMKHISAKEYFVAVMKVAKTSEPTIVKHIEIIGDTANAFWTKGPLDGVTRFIKQGDTWYAVLDFVG